MPTAIPIHLVTPAQVQQQYGKHPWLQAAQFKGESGNHCLLPSTDGALEAVLVGRPDSFDPWLLGGLAQSLPPQTYRLASELTSEEATLLGLGWHLGQYRFDRYKQSSSPKTAKLELPQGDQDFVKAAAKAIALARDLINTPAGDMGPEQLEARVKAVADEGGAKLTVIRGDELLAQNYPLIHGVGRASEQAPRLLDLRWGDPS
ncbi:MAG: leucyl aminopeptidase family protein, partial [Cyanobacteria bacterium P01_A01_bin.135]